MWAAGLTQTRPLTCRRRAPGIFCVSEWRSWDEGVSGNFSTTPLSQIFQVCFSCLFASFSLSSSCSLLHRNDLGTLRAFEKQRSFGILFLCVLAFALTEGKYSRFSVWPYIFCVHHISSCPSIFVMPCLPLCICVSPCISLLFIASCELVLPWADSCWCFINALL